MHTARNLYIYLTCAVSLQGVAWAVVTLLQDLLPPGRTAAGEGVAFQIAVIVIGLPVLLIHWLWAQRLAEREEEERGAVLRRFYLYGTLAAFLGPSLHSTLDLLITLVRLIFGLPHPRASWSWYRVPDPTEVIVNRLILLAVFALLWGYHWWTVTRDAQDATESAGGAVVRRLYILGFSAAGLTLTMIGLIQLLRWIMYQFAGEASLAREILPAHEVPRLLLGGLVWVVCWSWAQRLAGRDDEERESVLRKLYLYLAVFIGVMGAVSSATFLLRGLLRRLLQIPAGRGGGDGDIYIPLSIIVGMALLWAYHAYVLRRDAAAASSVPRQVQIQRIYLYLVAAVGFGALLEGLGGDISALIRSTERGLGSGHKEQLAWSTAVLIAGLLVWIVPWRRLQLRAAEAGEDGMIERRSIVRRVYLYFYLFVATMTALSSAVYIVYRLISRLLGVGPRGNLLVDMGQSIAFLLLSAGVWLYHGYLLRADRRLADRDRLTRLEGMRVAVVDLGEGEMGGAVLEGLRRELPGVALDPVGLTESAAAAMGAGADPASLADRLAGADLIVGPWVMAVAGGAAGTVPPEVARTIVNSPARKVLVPTQVDGWEWAGVERWKPAEIVQQAVRAVNQLAWGEEVRPTRRLSGGAILAIIVGVLFLLTFLVLPLTFYLMW